MLKQDYVYYDEVSKNIVNDVADVINRQSNNVIDFICLISDTLINETKSENDKDLNNYLSNLRGCCKSANINFIFYMYEKKHYTVTCKYKDKYNMLDMLAKYIDLLYYLEKLNKVKPKN